VRSVSPAGPGKATKVRSNGRHRARSGGVRRAVKIVTVGAPALALAGWLVAAQAAPRPVNPVASGVASIRLDQKLSGTAVAEAARAARLTPARSSSPSASPAGRKKSVRASASPAKATPASSSPAHTGISSATLTCTGTGGTGMLPLNYAAIVNFLAAHGYTDLAAAGIAGNIWQESKGNPESVGTGGGGLIGWTPLPVGFVTGDPAADLQTQLEALLSYNQGWAQYIPLLNAATSAVAAADVYMDYFERPGLPAASNREGAAGAVAQACGIS
jgi:hypothetical protein